MDDAPVLAGIETASLAYTENDPATAVTATLTVNDVDSVNLAGASVQITGNYQPGQDVLSFGGVGGITGTWNSGTGTLTLSGGGTVSEYQSALRSVKYQNTSDSPSGAARTVSFKVSDGTLDSNVASRSITVTPVDDAPVLAGIETIALAYTENDPATAVTATITVNDVDSVNLAGASVQITGNYQAGQDVLSFGGVGGITGTWDSTTGTLTLSGSDTVANYQSALRSVKYQNTSDSPSGATRTVSFKVNDGQLDSNVVTRTVTVTPVDDAPVLAGIESSALAYTENDPATAVTATITVNDVDSANLAGASGSDHGQLPGGPGRAVVRGRWGDHGHLGLDDGHLDLERQRDGVGVPVGVAVGEVPEHERQSERCDADGEFQGERRAVGQQCSDADGDGDPSGRRPGAGGDRDRRALAYTENDPATAVTATITVNDVDGTNLAGASVQITGNYQAGQDVLSFGGVGGITGTWDSTTGTLTLSGGGTVSEYQSALRSVKYQNTSDSPSGAARTVSFKVSDGQLDSNVVTRTVTVTPVDDAPVLAGIETSALAYTENDPATAVTATLTVNDVDSVNLAGASVQITGNYQPGQDVLSFGGVGGITGTWNSGTGTLTLSGGGTVSEYQSALRSVKYQNTSDSPSGAARTVSFKVSDGQLDSNVVTRTVTVTPVDDAPVLAGIETIALAYTENDPATAVTATITVNDVDSVNLAGASVQITGNYQAGQDVLSFGGVGGITGTWDSTTGTLTLSGSDTVANYQSALRSVKYQNTSDSPSGATRTVSFKVNDGQLDSNVVTRTVTVTPVDDAPVLAGIETAPWRTRRTTQRRRSRPR